MFGEQKMPKSKSEKEDKPFKCSGCGTPLSKFDETCPNCERINPHYILG